MTDTNSVYLTNLFTSRPDISATEAARLIGVARPYIYELAKTCGFQRVAGQWVTAGDIERQGDALFQMVAEIHEATVGRKRPPVEVVLSDTAQEPAASEQKTNVKYRDNWDWDKKEVNVVVPYHGAVINARSYDEYITEAIELLNNYAELDTQGARRLSQLAVDLMIVKATVQFKSNIRTSKENHND